MTGSRTSSRTFRRRLTVGMTLLSMAVFIGKTRLIDNVVLG